MKILKVVLSVAVVTAIAGAYVFPSVKPFLGSVSGPELFSPFFSVDGVKHEYRRVKLATATTTPCAIKSPSATSSLLFTGVQVTTATSTATTWTAARATTAFATTTQLAQFSLASGALGSMINNASTTNVTDGAGILAPNTYVVWGVQGITISDAAGTKLNGFCQAEFLVF